MDGGGSSVCSGGDDAAVGRSVDAHGRLCGVIVVVDTFHPAGNSHCGLFVVADVAGAAAGNFGKAAAQNIRNKAALGEAAVQSKYWASPEQEARWGVNPMKRAALYAALKNRTKKENLANILEAAANTISSVLGTSVGAYRQGKMLEAMRDNPLTKAQIDAARNPYGSTAERARKAIQSLSSSK